MNGEFVSCPQCGQSIDPQSRTCEHCGDSFLLTALLAERDLAGLVSESNYLISPEILVPRLGEYLEEKGILSAHDLQEALEYQEKLQEDGEPRLIGQTLLALGLVQKEQLDQAITEQILQLQSALQKTNTELEARVRERTTELENALNRLTELSQLKANLIANISHELRTPLTHIKGYIELLIENDLGPLNQDQVMAIDVMRKSEERLEQLIEDLLQFSLLERGDLDLKIEEFFLNEILETVVSDSRNKCKPKSLSFSAQIPREIPKVRADQEKISWVLAQLIDNAIKFTPERGEVGLQVFLGSKWVVFSVYDSGIGIETERIDELFQPFHQLDGSSRRHYGGTGLGLAMAQKIAVAHGSKIRVQSVPGSGSTFEFSVPRAMIDSNAS